MSIVQTPADYSHYALGLCSLLKHQYMQYTCCRWISVSALTLPVYYVCVPCMAGMHAALIIQVSYNGLTHLHFTYTQFASCSAAPVKGECTEIFWQCKIATDHKCMEQFVRTFTQTNYSDKCIRNFTYLYLCFTVITHGYQHADDDGD